MGPEFVLQIRDIVTELENDDRVKVVVFESAVDGFFLNHSDFLANFEDLTSIPQGPTGLEAWPDVLVRLTRAPFVSRSGAVFVTVWREASPGFESHSPAA